MPRDYPRLREMLALGTASRVEDPHVVYYRKAHGEAPVRDDLVCEVFRRRTGLLWARTPGEEAENDRYVRDLVRDVWRDVLWAAVFGQRRDGVEARTGRPVRRAAGFVEQTGRRPHYGDRVDTLVLRPMRLDVVDDVPAMGDRYALATVELAFLARPAEDAVGAPSS